MTAALVGSAVGTVRVGALAVGAAALLEVAWVVLYAFGYFGALPVLYACTFAVCFCAAVLLAVWMRAGRSETVCDAVFRYATALMGAFMLYTLFSVLPDPIVASYAYAPAACALLLWRLSSRPHATTKPAKGWGRCGFCVGLIKTVRLAATGWRLAAATGLLFVALGICLAVVTEPNPPLGAFYGLGIASLVLAAVSFFDGNRTRAALRNAAGPFAIAGVCSIPLFGPGTAFAVFLAGCGVYVVWILAAIELSASRDDADAWRCQVLALAGMSLCVLLGLSCVEWLAWSSLATRGAAVALAAVCLVAADALWRVFAARAEERVGGHAEVAAAPFEDDALWLAATYGLSPRETQVAALLCENRSVGYICTKLGLATSTVKTHISKIYEKSDVHGKDELQLLATNRGR